MNLFGSNTTVRIGGIKMHDATRAELESSASVRDFHELAKQPRLEVLQCSAPVRDAVWSVLNEHFCTVRPDVQIRVYGHYSANCDLNFVRLLPNVRRFAADCLMQASGIESIALIPNLETLSLGIFELHDFNVLESISPKLASLSLTATRSKKPSLAPLRRFRSLRNLYLEGHCKDIEVISDLPDLEKVTLRSITTPDVGYLSKLPTLRSLAIKLGGIRNFKAIEGMQSIQYLELWQIRDLHDIQFISTLPGLQYFFLQSLPHIAQLPRLSDSRSLRRVGIENLKALHDFTALETAPALKEFFLIDGRKQIPQQLLPVLNNPNLRRASAFFGSERKNAEFLQLRDKYGKSEMIPSEPLSSEDSPMNGHG
ncbi:leucine-rich repeat domain-containing protein [Schlesneria paludicola]|uniref:hypothetical protein n=1 Tax=Schlesneria paludicola TaxID=360056 RepID=UPI00029AC0AF|nr:hypothetical protein [Schlesneria paludicola]